MRSPIVIRTPESAAAPGIAGEADAAPPIPAGYSRLVLCSVNDKEEMHVQLGKSSPR